MSIIKRCGKSRNFINSTRWYEEHRLIDVQEAKQDGDYRIWLKFSSGEEGIIDLADIVTKYPTAQPLLDTEAFKQFFLDEWPTLAWSCSFDLSPERLYELATGKAPAWIHTRMTRWIVQWAGLTEAAQDSVIEALREVVS